MYTPLSRRVSTWLNASEIAGTCGITEVNETSHQRLLCKQLQTARLGTRCDPLPWAVFACLLAVGYYLSLCTPGWLGRECRWGGSAEVSGVTAGCCEVLNPGRVPALPQAPSPVLGRGQIDRVSSTPSRETCAEAPEMCWSWVQQQSSGTGMLLWLWWQALFMSWTEEFRCGSTLPCLHFFCDGTGVLIWGRYHCGGYRGANLVPAECLQILCWYLPWPF